jgi:hypothetical protein
MTSTCSAWGPTASYCEHGNEPLDSIKAGEFVDQLSAHQLIEWKSNT